MSAKLEREAIGGLFLGAWDASAYPVQTPNEDFEPPASNAPWVRLSIITGDASRTEISGTNRYTRTLGLVMINVFTETGTGDGTAREIADEAADIFRGAIAEFTNGSVRFREPSVKAIGTADNEAYYQVNMVVPYYRDEIITA